MDPDLLTLDARRFARRFPGWGRTGVSGYYARGEDEVTALCQTRLVNFATVVVFTWPDLERHGIDVVATFRTPHVTLAAADSQTLVPALIGCPHQERPNPYHGNNQTEEVR